jgi:hypothetical protein
MYNIFLAFSHWNNGHWAVMGVCQFSPLAALICQFLPVFVSLSTKRMARTREQIGQKGKQLQ